MAIVLKPPQKHLLLSPSSYGAPKVDWTHPLANGLVGCWLPGISRGIDLTGNCPDLTLLGTPAGNFWTSVPEGPAFGLKVPDGTNSPTLSTVAPTVYKSWNTFSMYYRGDRNGVSSNTTHLPTLIWISYDNAIDNPYVIAGIGDANNQDLTTAGAYWNVNGVYIGTGLTTSFNQAGTLSMLATFDSANPGNVSVYKNGALSTSESWGTGGAPISNVASQIMINGGWPGLNRVSPTLCYLACLWNRKLSASEAALIDADPYGFLIPAEGEMPALFAASAPTTPIFISPIQHVVYGQVETIGY